MATAPYRVVDPASDAGTAAPVVPPSPPPADARRRGFGPGTESVGHSPVEAGRGTRWTATGRRRGPRDDQGERALRALVTQRGSQVSPTAALRAREVEVPTADDLAAAEQEIVIVRRNYVPPTALPPSRRAGRGRPEAGGSDRPRARGWVERGRS